MSTQSQQPEKKNSNRGLVWVIGLLVIALAVIAYMMIDSKGQVTDLELEKENLLFDLKEMKANLEDKESTNDSLDAYIVAETRRLNNMIDSVSTLREDDLKDLNRYKRSVYSLKRDNKKLIAQVDSLNKANAALIAAKAEVELNLAQEMARTENLTQQNQMLSKDVEMGKILQITKMEAGAYRVRSSGSESETQRARRADRVKTCFTLGKNLITEKGEKPLYMRVTTPDGRVMVGSQEEGEKTFDFNGQPLLYSSKMDVWYENEPMDVCMFIDKSEDFAEGEYTVQIYTEGYQIAEAKFILD
ncbi:MAG: hypothetical protein LPK46_05445 [Bacteroidota bacterium]|nr:hypothetical protein [Bacteroidota bacterium]MDX5427664.1 hypothetical protein [Bacteroidota bacterium]MDX5505566.1 hypothetical protein [Bacteroidota bacterium]